MCLGNKKTRKQTGRGKKAPKEAREICQPRQQIAEIKTDDKIAEIIIKRYQRAQREHGTQRKISKSYGTTKTNADHQKKHGRGGRQTDKNLQNINKMQNEQFRAKK